MSKTQCRHMYPAQACEAVAAQLEKQRAQHQRSDSGGGRAPGAGGSNGRSEDTWSLSLPGSQLPRSDAAVSHLRFRDVGVQRSPNQVQDRRV